MDVSIEIDGDSDEAIALALLQTIIRAEGKEAGVDRHWILSTYRQCLAAVQGEDWEEDEDDDDDEEEDDEDGDEEEEDEREEAPRGRRGGQ